MGLTYTQYAAHRKAKGLDGATHAAVSQAVKAGRIEPLADGTIDPKKADRQWRDRTQTRRRGRPRLPPVLVPAIAPSGPADAGDKGGEGDAPPEQITIAEAERRKLVAEALTKEEQLARLRGETITTTEAEAFFYAWARAERGLWQQLSARVYAQGAAELGCDPVTFRAWLDRTITTTLTAAGELAFSLRPQERAA